MLRVFFLISLEGFRFIVRGMASGHLVIACLDFAFIAASGGASYREGQACPREKQRVSRSQT
jgi:hypothetical protein